MLVTFWLTAGEASGGVLFVAMNYSVHAVMYGYYYLTSCGYRPNWSIGVTLLQLSQMFGGHALVTSSTTRDGAT